MMGSTLLEAPGKWRAIAIVSILCLTIFPAAPLLWQSLPGVTPGVPLVGSAFLGALAVSLGVGATVTGIGFLIGLPAGALATLHEFPGRRLLLAFSTVPLMTPSFLWAIGWSKLAIAMGPSMSEALSWLGPYLVFGASAVPLVLWTSLAATSTLTSSQLDAARLAGGEIVAFASALRQAAVPALLASVLGGVVTLSDAGPDQIFGSYRAASQILASFSAQHDYELAGRQCVLLAGTVLALAAPMAILAAPRLAAAVLARQVRRPVRSRGRAVSAIGTMSFLTITIVGTALPLVGLGLPLLEATDFGRALATASRTGFDSLIYACGGAAVALVLAFVAAFAVGRDRRPRQLAIGFSIAVFSLPPALPALGWIQLGTVAPCWADPLLRSKATVCLALGLRFLPVALLFALRGWATLSRSWTMAAGLHGVPLAKYLRMVALPHLAPALAAALALVTLLSMADLTTVLLLHPPGASSLPLSVFTIMANAPESLVASLCITHVCVIMAPLLVGCRLAAGTTPSLRPRSFPAPPVGTMR